MKTELLAPAGSMEALKAAVSPVRMPSISAEPHSAQERMQKIWMSRRFSQPSITSICGTGNCI